MKLHIYIKNNLLLVTDLELTVKTNFTKHKKENLILHRPQFTTYDNK